MKAEKRKDAFSLKGGLVVEEAPQLREVLLSLGEKVNPGETVRIDLSQIDEIDSAGVQVLISFQKMMRGKQVTVEWLKMAEEFKKLLILAGIHKAINLS
jgi:anti-anti-sigma factor